MIIRSKVRWLCRRGSLELDLILSRYLDRRYDHAPAEEQQSFQSLLGFADAELQRFFIAQEDPADPELLNLVRTIRSVASNIP
ncbi:MAG: succinate dehydrogenase assembly factor 2 [Methylococcaceae bacterium]|nr:succinate dehydrogenase assembly factor 2 [Methylococcaceae bacterium]MCI0733536.1 succinate dehydrogenase assembly factor 2 [Methylococcaceae bacterium]